ncbi:MAG TPA: Calx-beta domain-containing protein [Acidimicrobiales bacterium]|nr:Calx-beta domain-containing protein [Acidimicrobiales bacterium]
MLVAGLAFTTPAGADTLPPECVTSGGVITCTYSTTGEHTFVVPTGVTQASFTATGGAGGSFLTGTTVDQTGGRAAIVAVPSQPVTPGTTLYVEVGGRGLANTETDSSGLNGGANGGGRGRTAGVAGGGGGASDIRTAPASAGLSPDPRLVIAAGGGGAGGLGGSGGAGGDADSPGAAGFGSPNSGGAAGFPTGTSAPGAGASDGGATAGTHGQGGDGGYCGGGGGGGFYGGGGGNNASSTSCSAADSGPTAGGGGGGGQSLVPAGGSYTLAALGATPQVVIAYAAPATTTPVRVKVPDRSFTEGAKAHYEKFVVRLSDVAAEDVNVDFHTTDGTAIAGVDYVATSGHLTIPAGAKVGAVRVRILGNTTPQSNRAFSLVITNPSSNAHIVDDTGVGTIVDDD